MTISDYLVTDDLTVLLGFIGVSVFLLQNIYKPQPLVHPILLGRQSDAGRVRHPGESAVYRNYGTGLMGRFPVRPDKDVDVVTDFVKPEFDAPRTLWSTKITNAQLKARVSAFGSGIAQLVPEDSTVLILLNDCIEFVITDLALSEQSIASITLSSPKLLARVLEMHPPNAIITDNAFLPHVLQAAQDVHEHNHQLIVVDWVPRPTENKIHSWNDVESRGKVPQVPKNAPQPGSPYTVSFFETPSGEMRCVQLSHENFTSGVTAIKALFPAAITLSTLDTIVSSHSLSTPYGRAIAYAALFEGASFATLPSTGTFHDGGSPALDVADILSVTNFPIPSPTVLFLKPEHVQSLASSVVDRAKKSFFMFPLAWRHKFASLTEGFLTKDSLWDRTVFGSARENVLGKMADTVKAVVIGGPLPSDALVSARLALSIPVINTHTHGSAAGPLFATHAFDLQMLPSSSTTAEPAHVGAPSVNVEVKLLGVNDNEVEKGADPVGEILVRGPSVGNMLSADGEAGEKNAWVHTGEKARVMTNGAFKILGSM
jgi:long-chain acyl-CoA synthetase